MWPKKRGSELPRLRCQDWSLPACLYTPSSAPRVPLRDVDGMYIHQSSENNISAIKIAPLFQPFRGNTAVSHTQVNCQFMPRRTQRHAKSLDFLHVSVAALYHLHQATMQIMTANLLCRADVQLAACKQWMLNPANTS